MSSTPVIRSPSALGKMSQAELDLFAQAASASGFNPYDILYGSPPNNSSSSSSPPLGPRTSTPAGSSIASDLSFEAQFSPSIPPTPSPTPRRRGRQPASFLNLAREGVRAQGINPMEFMARPLREAGRRGGRGPIVVPPYTPSRSPLPSSLDISSLDISSSSSRRRRRGRGRGRGRERGTSSSPSGASRRRSGPSAAGGGGGDDDDDDDDDISRRSNRSNNSSRSRRSQRRQELLRELQRLQQDNIEKSHGRQIAGVTHTNTITTTYKDGGAPTVSRSSSTVSN